MLLIELNGKQKMTPNYQSIKNIRGKKTMKHLITTDIHVPEGKEAIISMVDARRWVIPFKPLGKRIDRDPETIEAVEHICKFNRDELYLLEQVNRHVDDDSRLTLRPSSYTPADQARLKRAVRLWIKKELLVRLKRERYMVNPWFLVPPKHEQLSAVNLWRVHNPQYPRQAALPGLSAPSGRLSGP